MAKAGASITAAVMLSLILQPFVSGYAIANPTYISFHLSLISLL